jgi:hypothetical protein
MLPWGSLCTAIPSANRSCSLAVASGVVGWSEYLLSLNVLTDSIGCALGLKICALGERKDSFDAKLE